eukprot:Nitzschia sp. Nitz4//scaffold22_size323478//42949//44187//NITZ4_000503-RA/size323478-processed-gene-0.384-mRNA-1//1//CDS//3329542923//4917//frame0
MLPLVRSFALVGGRPLVSSRIQNLWYGRAPTSFHLSSLSSSFPDFHPGNVVQIPHNYRPNRKNSTKRHGAYERWRKDRVHLKRAIDLAQLGQGRTFPNPAVGCVLVQRDTNRVLGSGFHPRAGFPHAEPFALMEAAGYVKSGIEAAQVVAGTASTKNAETLPTLEDIQSITDDYIRDPKAMFGGVFQDIPVTAYVTLEPCCHTGKKTPPCAHTLIQAGVQRVVIGFRDPNPSVDGAGVELLQQAGIEVEVVEGWPHKQSAKLVSYFLKRISPKPYDVSYDWLEGDKVQSLRRHANRLKAQNIMPTVLWSNKTGRITPETVDSIELPAGWMENTDAQLWDAELVNIRFNKAADNKKLVATIAGRIANVLQAKHIYTVGHTALLYRPGSPPVLDLNDMVEQDRLTRERKREANK